MKIYVPYDTKNKIKRAKFTRYIINKVYSNFFQKKGYEIVNITYDDLLSKKEQKKETFKKEYVILPIIILRFKKYKNIKAKIIGINTEPIYAIQKWKTTLIPIIKKKITILLDYSEKNIEYLKKFDIKNMYYIPPAYCEAYKNIFQLKASKLKKPNDILFYGNLTPRRRIILNSLLNKGLKIKHITSFKNFKRMNEYISKTKLIINFFSYDKLKNFDFYRLSYLLSNSVLVLNEIIDNNTRGLKDNLLFAKIEDFPKKIKRLLEMTKKERQILQDKHHNYFKTNWNITDFTIDPIS